MSRSITKTQAKTIILREAQVDFFLQTLGAIVLSFVSVTLSIALMSCALAGIMRAYLMVDGRTGAEIRVPASALALALPLLFMVVAGEYMLQFHLPLYLLITFGSAIYFGAIRKDHHLQTSLLYGDEEPFLV